MNNNLLKILSFPFMALTVVCCINSHKIVLNEKVLPLSIDPNFSRKIKLDSFNHGVISGGTSYNNEFKLCFEDKNNNGCFFDKGIDYVGISESHDSVVLIGKMFKSNSYWGSSNIYYENLLFYKDTCCYRLLKANEKTRSIRYKKLNTCTNFENTSFGTTTFLPKLKVRSLLDNQIINLDNKQPGYDYVLIVFWAPWCPPCLEEIPVLQELSKYKVKIINICATGEDQNEIIKVINQYQIPGLHIMGTHKIEDIFFQNGYPYINIYDKNHKMVRHVRSITEAVNLIVKR